MKIGNVTQVLNRINEIEAKFNFTSENDDKSFEKTLQKELQPTKATQNHDNKKTKIIITVFGRADEIKENLITTYKVDKNRIISLDILDD